jgi:hypothetical protein
VANIECEAGNDQKQSQESDYALKDDQFAAVTALKFTILECGCTGHDGTRCEQRVQDADYRVRKI